MKLRIVADKGVLFSKQVKKVELPGREGKFTLYPGHARLVAILDRGEITYIDSAGQEGRIDILSGFVDLAGNTAEVFAEAIMGTK